MLIDSMMENFVIVDKSRVPDGEGGFITEWHDGAKFKAALVFDDSITAKIAQKQGVTNLYTLTCDKNVPLDYHDVFKRASDSTIYRITSNNNGKVTPKTATFEFQQLSAEEWKLTS